MMKIERMTWKEKRKYLFELVKKVSDQYGGDEESFLDEYVQEMVEKYKDDLETPIRCFEGQVFK